MFNKKYLLEAFFMFFSLFYCISSHHTSPQGTKGIGSNSLLECSADLAGTFTSLAGTFTGLAGTFTRVNRLGECSLAGEIFVWLASLGQNFK